MKKALFKLIQICLLNGAALTAVYAQTCTFTNLRLESQAAVNSFNSSCKTIKGDITIIGADITDLRPLANIELVDGNLTIQNNSSLTSLTGLGKLAGAKNLLILNNGLLTNLSGLEGLTSVSTTLRIGSHSNLVSLNGLNNLTTAGSVYISTNDLLPNLSGLGSLGSVSDLISISGNKALVSLNGLTSLTSVARILIGQNDILPDLSGLESLQSVSWQMNVSSNKSLLSFNGLDNLTSLSELYISDNNLMTDMSGLETINAVYWLVIGESKGLTSLNGLHNLLSATNFIIRSNPLLTDLSGLGSLTNIGWIQISDNALLTSLEGLGSGSSGGRTGSGERVSASLAIGGLAITNNSQLTTCAIAPVCDFVSAGIASISGNGTGCESQAAVETACGSLPVTLVNFAAATENRTALLRWETTEESNSFVFEIEHSMDAKTWKNVGKHAAKGESIQLVKYHWVHQTPGSGLNYYRLKMIDWNGTYAYSHITTAKVSELGQSSVFIYPNPVSEVLYVKNSHEIARLLIVNSQGKTVYETRKVSNTGVSVKKLATGFYQVNVTKHSGEVQALGMVIN